MDNFWRLFKHRILNIPVTRQTANIRFVRFEVWKNISALNLFHHSFPRTVLHLQVTLAEVLSNSGRFFLLPYRFSNSPLLLIFVSNLCLYFCTNAVFIWIYLNLTGLNVRKWQYFKLITIKCAFRDVSSMKLNPFKWALPNWLEFYEWKYFNPNCCFYTWDWRRLWKLNWTCPASNEHGLMLAIKTRPSPGQIFPDCLSSAG